MNKKLCVMVLVVLVSAAVCWAATELTENTENPDHPGKCWIKAEEVELDIDEDYEPFDKCQKIICKDGFKLETDTCDKVEASEGFHIKAEDPSDIYPDCCPQIVKD